LEWISGAHRNKKRHLCAAHAGAAGRSYAATREADLVYQWQILSPSGGRPVAAMFITDVVRIHCLFGPVRGDFYYRKFICGFAVFFVTELRGSLR